MLQESWVRKAGKTALKHLPEVVVALMVELLLVAISWILKRLNIIEVWQGISLVLLVTLIICLGILSYRKKSRIQPLTKQERGNESIWYYPKYRLLSQFAFYSLTVACIFWVYTEAKGVLNQASKPLILIARFDGPDQLNYRVTETILDKLRSITAVYPDVRIESLTESVTELQGSDYAKNIGIKHRAQIVIWGWYGVTQNAVALKANIVNLMSNISLEPVVTTAACGAVSYQNAKSLRDFSLQTQLSDSLAFLTLHLISILRYSKGDLNSAKETYKEALALAEDPLQMLSIYIDLADIYMAQGNTIEGLNYYESARKIDRFSAYIPNNIGAAKYANGEYTQSIQFFSEAMLLSPESSTAYVNRANAYYEIGDLTKAEIDFSEALKRMDDLVEKREIMLQILAIRFPFLQTIVKRCL